MGSEKHKKHKKESRKRKHHSRSTSLSPDREEKEKRKHKKRHHKEKKKDKHSKLSKSISSESSDNDVIYVPPPPKISKEKSPSPPPAPKIARESPPPNQTPVARLPPSPPPVPPPVGNSNANSEQSLSIEETNALRAKLGLKPLAVAPKEEPKTELGSLLICPETNVTFVHKPAEDLTRKKVSEKLRAKLAEKREKRNIEKKLSTIKSLGADSDEDSGAVNWVKKSRKLDDERRKAQLKAKELDEMDEEFGIGDLIQEEIKKEKTTVYTGANLRGLKVEHNMDSFAEGKAVVLTLKDRGVLENEDDALVNVNMVDDERYSKNVLNRKKIARGYGAMLNDNDDDMDIDEESGVLSKYDEEIGGMKKSSFKLGESSAEKTKKKLQNLLGDGRNVKLESLATSQYKIASDYYTQDEIKIKKPKKKKKIRSRLIPIDTTANRNNHSSGNNQAVENSRVKVESRNTMDLDEMPLVPVLPLDDIKIEEESDTELELALSKARRLKQMPVKEKKQFPKIEEFMGQIKEEQDDDVVASSIVLNSTAEFCRTLGDIPTYGMAGNRDEEADLLDFERTALESKAKRTEEVDDRGGWNDVEMDERLVETKQIEGAILDAEPDLGSGVAGALSLAVSKGYLEKETSSRPSASRISQLAAQNYSIDDKAHAIEDEKQGRRDRYLGPTQDFKEKDSYKPNIKLEYIDDDGHLLCAKEAFRYLSHKFHGKGPGKNKVEKRMKKNEQEALMKQMNSSDTPLGTLTMLQHKQKETQSPFVVLSGSKALNMPASISKTKIHK